MHMHLYKYLLVFICRMCNLYQDISHRLTLISCLCNVTYTSHSLLRRDFQINAMGLSKNINSNGCGKFLHLFCKSQVQMNTISCLLTHSCMCLEIKRRQILHWKVIEIEFTTDILKCIIHKESYRIISPVQSTDHTIIRTVLSEIELRGCSAVSQCLTNDKIFGVLKSVWKSLTSR